MNDFMSEEDLLENPTPRVPISLCLDSSGSMHGSKIDELNKGVQLFYSAIHDDDYAIDSAEISIVSFGPAEILSNFKTLDEEFTPPILEAGGLTPMGEALKLSLDMLDERKEKYKASGVDYYQPWLVFMTDGRPEGGDPALLNEQIARITNLVNNKRLTVFPIAIGESVDMSVLSKISPNRAPLKLKGLNFQEFFTWLSKSVSVVSQSNPSDTGIKLDVEGIKSWAEL